MSETGTIDLSEIEDSEEGKSLYPFQEASIQQISDKLNELEDEIGRASCRERV